MKKRTPNNSVLYLIAFVVIIVAFLLLGGDSWLRDLIHGSGLNIMDGWNWTQILISLCLGFLLGLLFSKRKGNQLT